MNSHDEVVYKELIDNHEYDRIYNVGGNVYYVFGNRDEIVITFPGFSNDEDDVILIRHVDNIMKNIDKFDAFYYIFRAPDMSDMYKYSLIDNKTKTIKNKSNYTSETLINNVNHDSYIDFAKMSFAKNDMYNRNDTLAKLTYFETYILPISRYNDFMMKYY